MSDERDDDDQVDLHDPSEFEDAVSQRAMAFCHVARIADHAKNEAVRAECLTMLRKLNACIRTPPSGVVRAISDGPRQH